MIIDTNAYKSLRAAASRMDRPEILALVFRSQTPGMIGRMGDLKGKQIEKARIIPLIWMARFSDGPDGVRPCAKIDMAPSEAWMDCARLTELDRRRQMIVGDIPPEVRLAFGRWYSAPRVALPAYRWVAQILTEVADLEPDNGQIRVAAEILRQSIAEIEAKRAA